MRIKPYLLVNKDQQCAYMSTCMCACMCVCTSVSVCAGSLLVSETHWTPDG